MFTDNYDEITTLDLIIRIDFEKRTKGLYVHDQNTLIFVIYGCGIAIEVLVDVYRMHQLRMVHTTVFLFTVDSYQNWSTRFRVRIITEGNSW